MADPGRSMLGWNSGGSWLHGSCAQAAASKDDGKVVDPDESEEKLTFPWTPLQKLTQFLWYQDLEDVQVGFDWVGLLWPDLTVMISCSTYFPWEQFFSELVGLKLQGLRSNYTESWKLWGVQVPQHIWMKLLRDKVLLLCRQGNWRWKGWNGHEPRGPENPATFFKQ